MDRDDERDAGQVLADALQDAIDDCYAALVEADPLLLLLIGALVASLFWLVGLASLRPGV
jgi:hypothetical protein